MRRYLARRLLVSFGVVLGVVTLVFVALRSVPGDPVDMLIPADASGSAGIALAQQLRAKYGFDRPLYVQYGLYLSRLARFDLGSSIRSERSVAEDLLERYPATLELAVGSLVVAVALGVPAGILAALRPNSVFNNASMTLALLGLSLPTFWTGLSFMLLFSLILGWLPASGLGGPVWSWDGLSHLLMPAVTLGIEPAGVLARLTRSAMAEVLRENYIRTARAKGLAARTITIRHALRNALLPVVTVLGLQFGGLLSGAIVVETVFAWPGIGRYLVFGITGKDFPVVQGGVLVIACAFVLINLLVDVLYVVLDPRIAYT